MALPIRKAIFVPLLSAVGVLWFFAALGVDVSFGLLTTDDLTKGENPVCELHKIQMSKKRVPIHYGLPIQPPPEYFAAMPYVFPHAWNRVLGGCMSDRSAFHKRHAIVFSCPQCSTGLLSPLRAFLDGSE